MASELDVVLARVAAPSIGHPIQVGVLNLVPRLTYGRLHDGFYVTCDIVDDPKVVVGGAPGLEGVFWDEAAARVRNVDELHTRLGECYAAVWRRVINRYRMTEAR